MQWKQITVLACCCFTLEIQGAQSAADFCGSLQNFQLSDIQKTAKLIHSGHTMRTGDGASGTGRSAEDIERAIAPYTLSDGLKQAFADTAEDDDSDYSVYHTPDGSVFNFNTVAGSEKCPVDVWAVNNGGKLEKSDVSPDVGDGCDVVRLYGSYQSAPVLVQYTYGASSGMKKMSQQKIDEIRVVRIVRNGLGDVCVIKPR